MAQDKVNPTETTDETGYINTEELRDILKEENNKKQNWFQRLFSKKSNKNKENKKAQK